MSKVQIVGRGAYDGEEGIIVSVGSRKYIVYTDDEEFAVEWAINQYNNDEEEEWNEFVDGVDQDWW